MKKNISLFLLLVTVVLVVCSCGGSESAKKYEKRDEQGLGVNLNGSEYKLKVISMYKSDGNDSDEPKRRNEYVVVEVAIENRGKEKISYSPNDFMMEIGSQLINMREMINTCFTTVNSDTALGSGEIRSGEEVSGTIVFEIPRRNETLNLIYNNNNEPNKIDLMSWINLEKNLEKVEDTQIEEESENLETTESTKKQTYKNQQVPEIEWQKLIEGSFVEECCSIQQTMDGGYIIGGASDSEDGDYWIVKLDKVDKIEWQKSLGGSDEDIAFSIKQTRDGGYIIGGCSRSEDGDITGNHGGRDYWIVKLDKVGKIEWQKSLGGSDEDIAVSIKQTSDGGYIIAGYSYSEDGDVTENHGGGDYWIVKLDEVGKIEWQKSIGGSSEDIADSIQQTSDSGYIIAGSSRSEDGDVTGNHGNADYWIVKLDEIGKIEWEKTLGGSNDDYAFSIKQCKDGGYIIDGYSYSEDGNVTGNHGRGDYWIVKLDEVGKIEWEKTLGGSNCDEARDIEQTSDRGYIIGGSSRSEDGDVTGNHGGGDYWIVKLDEVGKIEWEKTLGGSNCDEARDIEQTRDGGYIIAGSSRSEDGDVTGNHGKEDCWIVKLKPDSNNSVITQDKK